MSHKTVEVALGERSYPILIGHGVLGEASHHLFAHLASNRVIILIDEALIDTHLHTLLKSLAASQLKYDIVPVPSGETSKSLAAYAALCEAILRLNPDRHTTLLTFGGGVVGDLGGFIAATLLRGIPFIQLPTTLLSQVDSSVGGKTGLNTSVGKNLVGAFYQPKAVLIDTMTLQTLPDRELRAGYGEIVKYGVLGDAEFFEWLDTHQAEILARKPETLAEVIAYCCSAKAEIVAEDERESGKRALLNLGHTFAHALEAEAGYDGTLLHGEAVSIGMVMAAHLSEQLDLCEMGLAERIRAHLQRAGCPVSPADIKADWQVVALLGHFHADKKNQNGKWVFILLEALGRAVIRKDVAQSAVRDTLLAFDGIRD